MIARPDTLAPTRDNRSLARVLREVAGLLEAQDANPFRVQAYRRAADLLDRLDQPAAALISEGGTDAIEAIPGIGPGIARAIGEVVATGRLALLDRLRGQTTPTAVVATLPGVGEVLAERIHHDLGVESLEDLELAAHDGRLEEVPGVGPKRLEGIRAALAHRLRHPRGPHPPPLEVRPPVADLLSVDREYRTRARRGTLRRIAPRRFNPTGQAWLPVLHTDRHDRHYTALFSNTALAHRLGRTHDWVVIYYDGRLGEGQATVVTEYGGPLRGRRVIRGREGECFAHYGVPTADPHQGTDGNGVI